MRHPPSWKRPSDKKDNLSYEDFREFIEIRPAETVANILISLIHQADYLLDQKLRRLEKDFLEQGGLRERMTRARLEAPRQTLGKLTGAFMVRALPPWTENLGKRVRKAPKIDLRDSGLFHVLVQVLVGEAKS